MPRALHAAALIALLIGGPSCAGDGAQPRPAEGHPERSDQAIAPAQPPASASPLPSAVPSPERTEPRKPAREVRAQPVLSEPRMVRATMRIPALGIRGLAVVPYRGSPDDGPGTRIQNGGVAASPFGGRGGVGAGQIGNYIVTAHRTTSPAPFADLPSLRRGDHVVVRTDRRVFDYRVTDTRRTSFRSRRSLARQSAAVPGHPGKAATRAMITLSTCATPEDHAAGNFWADEFGNPEHRIDKIGVLVAVRAVRESADRPDRGG